jgi:DNA-binding MarR family transcriptional regulator
VAHRRDELIANLARQIDAAEAASDAVDDAFADYLGVNRTDARCLELLARAGPMTAGELARLVRLTTGAVTAVLDRLEAVGYARRRRDAGDRRKILVDVTPRLRKRAADVYERERHATQDLVRSFTDDELERLIEFHERSRDANLERLQRLREKLERRPRRRATERPLQP